MFCPKTILATLLGVWLSCGLGASRAEAAPIALRSGSLKQTFGAFDIAEIERLPRRERLRRLAMYRRTRGFRPESASG